MEGRDTAFLTSQPKAPKKYGSSRKPHYTILTPNVPFQNADPDTVVGITMWRLREHKNGDAGERLLVHKSSKLIEFEPRRVSARTLFRKDDRVRITVETAHEGYLYVVDQEKYSNGKLGEPYLIFPVSTIRAGENHLLPGQIVEIPAQDDDPPYFQIRTSRPDHIGEQLTILIAPRPLKDIFAMSNWQRLSLEQYAQLERNSHISTGMAEMTAHLDSAWSKEEKNAGRTPTTALPATAPLPQTLFYSPGAGTQSPTIVKLVLKYVPQGR